jgi:regulation of enolase protein 1 (concanavalin A-like superfamily)
MFSMNIEWYSLMTIVTFNQFNREDNICSMFDRPICYRMNPCSTMPTWLVIVERRWIRCGLEREEKLIEWTSMHVCSINKRYALITISTRNNHVEIRIEHLSLMFCYDLSLCKQYRYLYSRFVFERKTFFVVRLKNDHKKKKERRSYFSFSRT